MDTSVTLRDEGISGYTGLHRDNPGRHALAAFLKLVETGRVAVGSYLLIENLDRLTREEIIPVLNLFAGILMSGIRIVQLEPAAHIYDRHCNPMEAMIAILELSRGHGEGRRKSAMVGEAWGAKKRRAADRTPATGMVPAWLVLRDGKVVVDRARRRW